MGAQNSREKINTLLRATSAELYKRSDAATESIGKLPRRSAGATNPQYRNPVIPPRGAQKKLGPANNIRKSIYELDPSPDKASSLQPSIQKRTEDFSPLRRGRSNAPEALEPSHATPGMYGQPSQDRRRSRRSENLGPEIDVVLTNPSAKNLKEAFNASQAVDGPASNTQYLLYGGRGRDPGLPDDLGIDIGADSVADGLGNSNAGPRDSGGEVENGHVTNTGNRSSAEAANIAPIRTVGSGEIVPSAQQESRRRTRASMRSARLADLRRRSGRLAQTPGSRSAQGGNEGLPANDTRTDRVRISDLNLGTPNKRKRNASSEDATANESRKRRKGDQAVYMGESNNLVQAGGSEEQDSPSHEPPTQRDQDEDAKDSDVAEDENSHSGWIFGQWGALRKVVAALRNIGRGILQGEPYQRNLKLVDEVAKAIVKLCHNEETRLESLKSKSNIENGVDYPRHAISKIVARIDGLKGLDENFPTDMTSAKKTRQIYFHVFPALVRLLMTATQCFQEIDQGEVDEGQISAPHLRIINILIKLILELERTLKEKYAKPNADFPLLEPVHNGIIVPLRTVHKAFLRILAKDDAQSAYKRRMEEEAKHNALRLGQEERRARQAAEIETLRTKWRKLHEERLWAEGGLMKPAKRAHLATPGFEIDLLGELFERVELFHARVGPSPSLIDAALARDWSLPALGALVDGLQAFAGPAVFTAVIRKYCGPDGELNDFNVTEIVTIAARIRQELVKSRRDAGKEVEGWITAIPVWTRGQCRVGKENRRVDPAVEVASR